MSSYSMLFWIEKKQHMEDAKKTDRYSHAILTILDCSLEKWLGGIVIDPLYCITRLLDPHFKLIWCNEIQYQQVKDMAITEMSLLIGLDEARDQSKDMPQDQPPPQKKTKMSKLISFLDASSSIRVSRIGSYEEELQAYLH